MCETKEFIAYEYLNINVKSEKETTLSFQLVEEGVAEVVPIKVTVEEKKEPEKEFQLSDFDELFRSLELEFEKKTEGDNQ